MNLALRGIEDDFSEEHADTFRSVQHPDLRAQKLHFSMKQIRLDTFARSGSSSWHMR